MTQTNTIRNIRGVTPVAKEIKTEQEITMKITNKLDKPEEKNKIVEICNVQH